MLCVCVCVHVHVHAFTWVHVHVVMLCDDVTLLLLFVIINHTRVLPHTARLSHDTVYVHTHFITTVYSGTSDKGHSVLRTLFIPSCVFPFPNDISSTFSVVSTSEKRTAPY